MYAHIIIKVYLCFYFRLEIVTLILLCCTIDSSRHQNAIGSLSKFELTYILCEKLDNNMKLYITNKCHDGPRCVKNCLLLKLRNHCIKNAHVINVE